MSENATKKMLNDLLTMVNIRLNGSKPWDIQIVDERAMDEILRHGSLGLGESYMKQWWTCDALDQFSYQIFHEDVEKKVKLNLHTLWLLFKSRLVNLQGKMFAKTVAKKHYNLGNELFLPMLGDSMAYSCGYWRDVQTLDEAQFAKYDLICRKLELNENDALLDIGCGWGGLAAYAATNYGCKVVALSNSKQQIAYAKEKHKTLPIDFFITDYRELNNYNAGKKKFSKIASVGFFEHVGYKNYSLFFDLAYHQLQDNGLFLLHTIGNNFTQTMTDPWINKYIFPHGMLPSMPQITSALEKYFIMEDWHNFGPDYDKTLMAWHQNFETHWPELQDNFDEEFYFMWRYYLLMCAGMFRARRAQLWQIVLSKPSCVMQYRSVR